MGPIVLYTHANKIGKILRAVLENKTKYTMNPGINYSLEADEDNTNRN